MGFIQGVNRNQLVMLPQSLGEYIAEDNPVRFIDAFVDSLDLQALGFEHAIPRETGRPPYHPGRLLRLYVYGYLNRIRSSRSLEREANRNLELMWLLGKLAPDFKSIADFRRHNRQPIRSVCHQFTLWCRELELFGRELIAIDGARFKAVSSPHKNFSRRRLKHTLTRIDDKIDRYLAELDRNDQQEHDSHRPSAEELKEKIQALERRQLEIQALQDHIEQTGYDPINDRYWCPAGEALSYRFHTTELGRDIRYYATSAGKTCQLRPRCTRSRGGRRITRWVHEHLLEEMQRRVQAEPDKIKRRKCIVEHPFGTIKHGMNQGHFLMRGLANVRAEMSLTVLAYNFKRVVNTLGVQNMIAALA